MKIQVQEVWVVYFVVLFHVMKISLVMYQTKSLFLYTELQSVQYSSKIYVTN